MIIHPHFRMLLVMSQVSTSILFVLGFKIQYKYHLLALLFF